MPYAKEEKFGPVAPILGIGSEEEGIAIATTGRRGSAHLCSRPTGLTERSAAWIEAEMVHINNASVNDEPNTALGGAKQFGSGSFERNFPL